MINNNKNLTDWMKHYFKANVDEAFGVLKDLQ